MCTLSVLARRGGGYLLAMNRDERVTRGIAEPPALVTRSGATFLAPRDRDAGGTWIAADARGHTLCLLNGDRPAAGGLPDAAAEPMPSRGQLALELMAAPDPEQVELELRTRLRRGALRFKPFQLLAVARAPLRARALEFDGAELHASSHAAPFVLTSNGLDPDGVAHARRARFRRFLTSGALTADDQALRIALLELHRSHASEPPDGDLFSICMHRAEVRTVSLTLVEAAPERVTMTYQPGQPCQRAAASDHRLP